MNLSSNNYLGLANDERLKEATIRATTDFGTGSGAVRSINGTLMLHVELEEKLAQFKERKRYLRINPDLTAIWRRFRP